MSTICDDLRAAILQAAMQGKLTKQLPEDGDTEDLLERIKAKKTTKNKAVRTITERDRLFDIPDNWQWARFGEIVDFNMGKTPPRAEASYWGNDIPWISIADMPDGEVLLTTKEKISNKAFVDKFKSKICPKETLIMSFKLTVGRCSILGIDAVHNEAIISINPVIDDGFAFRNYLKNMLPYLSNYGETKDAIKGRTLNSDSLNNLLIPVPPLAEQKRIVKKVDELMARVADLEKSTDALASLKSHYPDEMRTSLLQAAMQGKLTKQLPGDGDAEDLLKQIKAEKEKLIAEGKIKKQKALAPIADDEIPFSIPGNWKWVRLNDIAIKEIRRGKPPVYDKKGTSFAFAQKCNSKYNGIDLSLAKTISENSLKKYSEEDAIQTLDIIVNSTGTGTLGRVGLIDSTMQIHAAYYPDSHVTIVRTPKYISEYIYIILKNNEKYLEEKGEGSTNQKELKPLTIQNLLIPLPPVSEQKRIVERFNTIMQNINVVGDLIASE